MIGSSGSIISSDRLASQSASDAPENGFLSAIFLPSSPQAAPSAARTAPSSNVEARLHSRRRSRYPCPKRATGVRSRERDGTQMNFEFSEDSRLLRDQARGFLQDKCSTKVVRRVLDGEEPYARAVWQEIAGMGWLGAAIPEEYGGAGLGYEGLCVLAEEVGRAAAPIPFTSSVYLATEAILAAGNETQK